MVQKNSHVSGGYGRPASHPGASSLHFMTSSHFDEKVSRRKIRGDSVTMRLRSLSPKMFKSYTGSGRLVRFVEYFSELGGANLRGAGNFGPLQST